MKKLGGRFIAYAIQVGALQLSKTPKWTLKSGRISPYFFNSTRFSTGMSVSLLGAEYATAIFDARLQYDLLFGPAYKGISIAATTASALYTLYGFDIAFASNRKEEKDHAEGGDLIGMSLEGMRVVIVDDVITRGDEKRHAVEFVRDHGGTVVAIVITFDRQERGTGELSAVQEVERDLNIPIISIITVADLVEYLSSVSVQHARSDELAAIKKYQAEYGIRL